MAEHVKISGFKELDHALGELNKSTERTVLRRIAKKALEPMQARAKQLVPVDEGYTRDSIVIAASPLSRRAKSQERAEPKGGVRMFLGTAARNAVPREFGTWRTPAQPFMRPAFDYEQGRAIEIVRDELGDEIKKTAARAARRKARNGR